MFIYENYFENVVCEMAAIISYLPCVSTLYYAEWCLRCCNTTAVYMNTPQQLYIRMLNYRFDFGSL